MNSPTDKPVPILDYAGPVMPSPADLAAHHRQCATAKTCGMILVGLTTTMLIIAAFGMPRDIHPILLLGSLFAMTLLMGFVYYKVGQAKQWALIASLPMSILFTPLVMLLGVGCIELLNSEKGVFVIALWLSIGLACGGLVVYHVFRALIRK